MRVRFFSDAPSDDVPKSFLNGIELDAVPRIGEQVDIHRVGIRRVRDVQWQLGAGRKEVWIRLEER